MKSILSFLTAAAFLVATASAANQCPKGKGPDANGVCQYCSPGYYNDQDAGVCQPAQAGWYACGSQPMCFGATQQTQCGAGNYSGTGSSQCTTCPAGNICPSNTQTQPQQCVPGRYMDTTGSGATECKSCQVGTYNNEYGAVACCNCCAGTYNDQVSQTHCFYCGEHTNPQVFYSPVGATSVSQCQANPIAGTTNAPKGTCDVTPPLGTKAPGNCPAEQGTPLPTSGVQPKKRHLQCKKGFKKCPLYTGIGGFDCVDVRNDPEQCGGCVAVDGVTSASKGNEGTDCTAIPNVSIVGCVKGKCVVETCRKGFTKSEDGSACESAALKVQRHQQHSDGTKRNARRWHVAHSEN